MQGQADGAMALGHVISVSGSQAEVRLFPSSDPDDRITIGKLVAVATAISRVIGVVSRLSVADRSGAGDTGVAATVDFLGEIRRRDDGSVFFQKGVTDYPTYDDKVDLVRTDDISLIHHLGDGETIEVGRLQLDQAVPAFIDFDELLSKHFAILGTTGVGKSTAVSLILNRILEKKSNLRVFLIDPHNEYGNCFGDMAHVLNVKSLRLPFWLFNFEEIVDVFFRGRPGVEEETEILSELIPVAKAQFASNMRSERILVRKATSVGYIADTPVPYRISDLLKLLTDRMGKLENRSSWMKYHRLVSRIESLGHDSRYTFMFNNVFIEDLMADVIGDLFRMPLAGKPITVMQLAGLPSEVVDSVVSVVCRMAFEFGVWSDGAAPILVASEEAHRYAPADRKLGFGPTRKALSRIAKEGRKYGVFLAAITQRPADLDATILSQCSTIFAMRMANDRDQEIVTSATPDAGVSLLDFLPSLGIAEAIAFGEGVALPTRIHFDRLPAAQIPRAQSGPRAKLHGSEEVDSDFIAAVVDRWREATTTNSRPRMAISGVDRDGPEAMDDAAWGAPLAVPPERQAR
ncbi:MAG TPA: DUF87 domain-containing protein [Bauldia sp.]|nr:DUF87 domain-containing protein [Bauldia sp.]